MQINKLGHHSKTKTFLQLGRFYFRLIVGQLCSTTRSTLLFFFEKKKKRKNASVTFILFLFSCYRLSGIIKSYKFNPRCYNIQNFHRKLLIGYSDRFIKLSVSSGETFAITLCVTRSLRISKVIVRSSYEKTFLYNAIIVPCRDFWYFSYYASDTLILFLSRIADRGRYALCFIVTSETR